MAEKKLPYLLPIAPLLPWLKEQAEKDGAEIFAMRCNISSRKLTEIFNGRTSYTSFDKLDAMLASEGSRSIVDFYPEYSEESFLREKGKSMPKKEDRPPGAKSSRMCERENCDRSHHAKGLCEYHYRRDLKPKHVAA
jgi:hypothetical protein